MNSYVPNPWRQAADDAGGFEGSLLKHNCKSGVVTLDGTAVGSDFRACLLMAEAKHGDVKFEDNFVEQEVCRYADAAPSKMVRPDWEPHTSVLAVSDSGALLTYVGANWSVRKAFGRQLVKPFVRLKERAFPVVTFGFTSRIDAYGNHEPAFNIVGWRPRGDFAAILGEEIERLAPPAAASESLSLTAIRDVDPAAASRDGQPISENPDADRFEPIDDEVPF